MDKFFLYFAGSIGAIVVYLSFLMIPSSSMKLYFLNIGQGDGILIEMPFTGHKILIDGGPSDAILSELGDVLPFYERKIDLLVLSHPHADHLNGLLSVLENYEVAAVLATGVISENKNYGRFFEIIEEKNIPFHLAHRKSDLMLGQTTVDVLFPNNYLAFQSIENQNNASVSVGLEYAGNRVILTGDSEMEQMREIYMSGADVSADVFKAAHHGSKTSLFPPLIREIGADMVVVQAGLGNKFEHPHEQTLDFFKEQTILRNDQSGRIRIDFEQDGSILAYDEGSTLLMSAPSS